MSQKTVIFTHDFLHSNLYVSRIEIIFNKCYWGSNKSLRIIYLVNVPVIHEANINWNKNYSYTEEIWTGDLLKYQVPPDFMQTETVRAGTSRSFRRSRLHFAIPSTTFNICVRTIASVSILTNSPRWRRGNEEGIQVPTYLEKTRQKVINGRYTSKAFPYKTDTISGLRTPSTFSPGEFHNVTIIPNINKKIGSRTSLEEGCSWKCRKMKTVYWLQTHLEEEILAPATIACRVLSEQY